MPIPVIAIAEDDVTAAIIRRLLGEFGGKYHLQSALRITGGAGKMDKNLDKWNEAAHNTGDFTLYFILRDMDSLAFPQDSRYCPETKINELITRRAKHRSLMLRLAVAEAENWLLADYACLCQFLSASRRSEIEADSIRDGKKEIIKIAKRSRRRQYRETVVPSETSRIGRCYNETMEDFIHHHWCPSRAAKNSKSLYRTLHRLRKFTL